MKFEKTYSIKKGEWTKWSGSLVEAIEDFHNVYTFYPNILEANDYTFSQLDFLTNINPNERQHVAFIDDVTGAKRLANETEKITLGSFNYDRYNVDIDFAIVNQLADKEFRLVYDDEPEWYEPETPEDCPENEIEKVSKIHPSIL